MLRVTLDTNVYVSGLNYQGSPYRLLELARDGRLLVIVSDQILDEVERILHEKFQWPKHRARQARRDIGDFVIARIAKAAYDASVCSATQ